MKRKKLCIDINSIVPLFVRGYLTGVGKTTFDLLKAFAELENLPFEIILYSQNMKGIGGENLQFPFKNKHLYYPHREKWDKILNLFPIKELLTNYDLMHVPHNFEYLYQPSKVVVTLHDALFMKMQEEAFAHDQMRRLVPPLMRKCKSIITCSEASKRDIMETMHIPDEKITVAPWGISIDKFYPASTEAILIFKKGNNLNQPYFLMVSCSTGRKNTISLMKSYKEYLLTGGRFDLVLLWNNPPQSVLEEYKSEIENKRIHLLSNLSESDLGVLYSGAETSFYPSRYEGFGLPILESMACGTPVVTCRNSSLPEVGGELALYTDPDDLYQMTQYMIDFENKNNFGIQKEQLLKHAAQFSWKRTAQQYVEFYKQNLE